MMKRDKIKTKEFICHDCRRACSRYISVYRYAKDALLEHMEYVKRQGKLYEQLEVNQVISHFDWIFGVNDDTKGLFSFGPTTHRHEWEMSPYMALTINAFQDGIALMQGDTWYLDNVTSEDEAFETDIATGETVTCNAIFVLRSNSPVEVVVEQPLDDTRVGLTCQVQ